MNIRSVNVNFLKARKAFLVSVFGCLLVFNSTARAEGLDLALSNETANLFLILNPFSPRAERSGRNPLRIAPRGSELSIGAFTNETGDNLLHATILAKGVNISNGTQYKLGAGMKACLLYTSPSPRDATLSRMPSSA